MSEATPPAKQQLTIRQELEGSRFQLEVAKVIPRHMKPERMIRVACTALTKTPLLALCSKPSFFSAMLTLSQLGLEPDGRRAHLIPFRNKAGGYDVQLILDYKGIAELVMRSGLVSFLHADVVCENDEFEYDRGQIQKHKIDFRKSRGQVYAVYSICKFRDGNEKCEVMSVEDVEGIRSRSKAANGGPWVSDWNEMAKKTVFKRLSKWLPFSPEVRDALENDDDSPADISRMRTVDSTAQDRALPELPSTPNLAYQIPTEENTATPIPFEAPKRRGRPPKVESEPQPDQGIEVGPVETGSEAEVPMQAESQVPPTIAVGTLPPSTPGSSLAHQRLYSFLTDNGIDWDTFSGWLRTTGRAPEPPNGLDEMSDKLADAVARDTKGLAKCATLYATKAPHQNGGAK
jgi:recombination protein RecT